MKKIYKYSIGTLALFEGRTVMKLPAVSRMLSLQFQDGTPVMWLEVDPACTETMEHIISIVPTGGVITNEAETYLATAQDGPNVWHFYTNRSSNFLKGLR